MNLRLVRDVIESGSTAGTLEVDGQFECYTLELPVLDGKPGSAIPPGIYSVIITYSPKFNRYMPLLVGIPGRSEIRIHWGNSPEDTDGCILVGKVRGGGWIGSSRAAFDFLWAKIEIPARAGDLTVEVVGGIPLLNTEPVDH